MQDGFFRSVTASLERLLMGSHIPQKPKPAAAVADEESDRSAREYELSFWRAAARIWY